MRFSGILKAKTLDLIFTEERFGKIRLFLAVPVFYCGD
ncbi:hypothetical protein P872_14480 [Rhodonellum psychrophilum GCM71 = DSM 17998]|uniref:Uncharacterized protein n=1 Tax=Rhodonellum psychrophilum GCM71 = DSM 17998 TaxID=1123057 RepID=U5BQG7_9BACT|nr:hypothetical protein P872_14480 [Rhodonellum psychrophilum GCM71 = DSM 17998]